jgi:hypothetical protein
MTRTDHRPISSHRDLTMRVPTASEQDAWWAASQFIDAWCAGRHDEVVLIAIGTFAFTDSDRVTIEFLAAVYSQAHARWQRRLPSAHRSAASRHRTRARRRE